MPVCALPAALVAKEQLWRECLWWRGDLDIRGHGGNAPPKAAGRGTQNQIDHNATEYMSC